MLQGPIFDLTGVTAIELLPQLAVPITVGLLLAAAIWLAFSRYGSAAGSYNWQLGLLMATGIALSIASGWTTWDGMQNFTHEPVLALLITFGIQSVLLVVSWLIGESFANHPRMTIDDELTGERAERGFLWSATSFLSVAAGFVALVIVLDDWLQIEMLASLPETLRNTLLKVAVGALAITLLIALCLTSGGNLFHRGIGLLRIAAQNATLWLMLIACMGASVFFSFDSLFSTIFPQDERSRASDIRTSGQISELINDVKARALSKRNELQADFSKSPEWVAFNEHLDDIAAGAERLPALLDIRESERLRQAQDAIGTLEVDLATAEARLENLSVRGEALRKEASRIRTSVANFAATLRERRDAIRTLESDIAANKVEAEKESAGLGVSATTGRGPVYRSLVRARQKLEFELELARQRASQIEQQIADARSKLQPAEAAAAKAGREIAEQTVKVATARKLFERATQQTGTSAGVGATTLIADQLVQLEQARSEAIRSPSLAAFNRVEEACVALAKKVASVPGTEAKDWQQRCRTADLRAAATAASQIALDLAAFEADCTGTGKLPESGETRELISFARKCIQLSGMPSDELAAFNDKVGAIALNRDDKAHRFVVTINAFGDGNRLAYLALAIALAIDGLVFASGVFYAQAARSPLSDIPGTDGRPHRELQNILDSALQPNAPESAAAALESIRPLMRTHTVETAKGYTHEIDTTTVAPAAQATISKLLGAAAAIGAVSRTTDAPNRYLMRGEIVTHLARHAHLSRGEPLTYEGVAALSQLLKRVLDQDVAGGAATVLKYFQPLPRHADFATRVVLSEIDDEEHADLVRKVLNAAAVLGYVRVPGQRANSQQYDLHRDVFVVLADLASRGEPQSIEEASRSHEAMPTDADQSTGHEEAGLPASDPPVSDGPPASEGQLHASTPEPPLSSPQVGKLAQAIEYVGPFRSRKSGPEKRVDEGGTAHSRTREPQRELGPRNVGQGGANSGASSHPQGDEPVPGRHVSSARPISNEVATDQREGADSDALDFGVDLSEPPFPDRLFESLEDEAAPTEGDLAKGSKKTRKSSVGSD